VDYKKEWLEMVLSAGGEITEFLIATGDIKRKDGAAYLKAQYALYLKSDAIISVLGEKGFLRGK